MHTRTQALLDGANRALHFANVAVGRDNVHYNRKHGMANALKFTVGVNVADNKAAGMVHI
jgi:hypothetical protein